MGGADRSEPDRGRLEGLEAAEVGCGGGRAEGVGLARGGVGDWAGLWDTEEPTVCWGEQGWGLETRMNWRDRGLGKDWDNLGEWG